MTDKKEEKKLSKFEEVYNINVNEFTEKKNGLTYLTWAHAWKEFKKAYPDANYTIRETVDGIQCFGNEQLGYMVYTTVTADNQTYTMWLPVMDFRNKPILKPNMFDINKTIMRCLTKNLAMFGLGLYIYAGEDLPDGEDKPQGAEVIGGSMANGLDRTTQEQMHTTALKALVGFDTVDALNQYVKNNFPKWQKSLDADLLADIKQATQENREAIVAKQKELNSDLI